MASLLLRNVPRLTTTVSTQSQVILLPNSFGNSTKFSYAFRTLPSSTSSAARSFVTGRCSRCHQLVKDPSSLSTDSSKIQRLFSNFRRTLTNSTKRNVAAASVEGLGGGASAAAAEAIGGSAWTHASGKAIPARAQKVVGYWLLGCAGACFAQVVLGGVTRLTESGLSMVDWHLIKGMKPPRTQEEWEAYFEKYKQFPEWKYLNEARGMTLEQFKAIFYFEYGHRMLGRAIGVAFLLPLGFFAAKKWIPKQMRPALFGCTALLGFQGGLGWYMVKSGLEDKPASTDVPRVSQYRLASHLGTAFVLYTGLLWNGLSLLTQPFHIPKMPITSRLRTFAKGNAGLVFITALSGAFVAGLDAGLVWNSYPKMGDNWIPEDVMRFEPKWINLFENTSTVQFDHRLLGHLTFASISALWFMSRKAPLPPRVKNTANALLGMAIIQVALGVTTILTYVPVPVAASHQAGSLTLLTIATYLVHELKRIPK